MTSERAVSGGVVRLGVTLLVLASGLGCRHRDILVPVDPNNEIAQVDCSCRVNIGGVGAPVCNLVRCQCAAMAAGACAASPRVDDDACRSEVADMIDTCDVFAGFSPERPEPSGIDLGVMDALCTRFASEGCTMTYTASICAGSTTFSTPRDFCLNTCASVGAFIDEKFSEQSDQYTCRDARLVAVTGTFGRKQECGQGCPSTVCTPQNIDTCTIVQTAADARCGAGFQADPFCRAPDSDPPMLNSGGVLADMASRRSRGEVSAVSTISFPLDGRTISLPLSGRVDILGEPCPRCPVSFHASLAAADAVFSGVSIDQIHLSAGTGTVPVLPVDATGMAIAGPGSVSGTLSMRLDGVPNAVTATSGASLNLEVNRQTKAFHLWGDVTLVADGGATTATLDVSGPLANQPPTAEAVPERTVECNASGVARVELVGQAHDPDGFEDLLRLGWYAGTSVAPGRPLSPWLTAAVDAPLGTTDYSFFAQDRSLQIHTTSSRVAVVDTTPPTIEALAYLGPPCLWAPNHKYVVLRADRDFTKVLSDVCDPNPSLVFLSGLSSQPDNGAGDGNTSNDVVVFPDHVCLRAERAGNQANSREYVLQLAARDASGNEADPQLRILVPHDQRDLTRCRELPAVEFAEDGDSRCAPVPPAAAIGATDPAPGCQSLPSQPLCLLSLVMLGLLRGRGRRAGSP